jgi:hypothetical protein
MPSDSVPRMVATRCSGRRQRGARRGERGARPGAALGAPQSTESLRRAAPPAQTVRVPGAGPRPPLDGLDLRDHHAGQPLHERRTPPPGSPALVRRSARRGRSSVST